MAHPWEPSRTGYRRAGGADGRMRISDADRRHIVDTLSRHFADGRLDNDEFEERLGRAMSAKTRGDLAGLLDDLPPLEPVDPPRRPRRHGPPRGRIWPVVLLVLVAFGLLSVAHHVPWILIGVVAFLVWRRGAHRRGCFAGPRPRRRRVEDDWA